VQVTQASSEPERARERRTQARHSLLVYHREGAQMVPLHPGASIVVGRAAPSDVTINDVSLSRQHARFTLLDDGQLVVEDLGSTNDTLVDGAPVERVELAPGQEVTLGNVTATFHALAADQAAPSSASFAGHDRFRAALEAEVVRAKFFGRRLAVVLVRATDPKTSHVRFWAPRAQALLRPVDRVGLYSDDSVHILLPEANLKTATDVAGTLVAALSDGKSPMPTVTCGIAIYPDTATHVEELLGESRTAAQRASKSTPIQLATSQEPRTVDQTDAAAPIVAQSGSMQQLLQTAARVARGNLPVLLRGETGTGKEVLSRYIHEQSSRKGKPLVCVNCAAIPHQLVESTLFGHERGAFTGANTQQKGVFEAGDGGTVFLDEIGELPAAAQAALLRVLETKRFTRVGSTKEINVDVRIVAATHRDLENMVELNQFRQDLLFRLNAITLPIPPLRERTDDIAVLAQRFLEQASEANHTVVRSLDTAAVELLQLYAWPGNVRELKNSIERAVVIALGDILTVDDLPERVRAISLAPPPLPRISSSDGPSSSASSGEFAMGALSGDFRTRMERLEAELLTHALREAGWNQTEAARQLSMPLRTLVYKIRMHGIRRPDSARRR
jgi:transcriptional regulator with GAF, ATPase, and Fis domain